MAVWFSKHSRLKFYCSIIHLKKRFIPPCSTLGSYKESLKGPDTEWGLITMVNCRTAGRKYYHHLPVKPSATCLETTDRPWFMLCFIAMGTYYSLKVIGIHQKQGFRFWILIMSWANDMHCHSLWLWDSWGCEKPDVFLQSIVLLF